MGMHQPFASQCYNTHWVPFRFTTSFIHFSSVQSTRCQIILLAGYPHFGCVHLATANCSCRTSISQSIAKVHLHSSAASVPCREIYSGGFLWSWHHHSFLMVLLPAPRGGSQPPSFLRASVSSVSYGGSPPTLQPRKLAGRLDFFFAAGAFTGKLDTLPLLLRKHYSSIEKFSRCIF